jgi:hypothetical protein
MAMHPAWYSTSAVVERMVLLRSEVGDHRDHHLVAGDVEGGSQVHRAHAQEPRSVHAASHQVHVVRVDRGGRLDPRAESTVHPQVRVDAAFDRLPESKWCASVDVEPAEVVVEDLRGADRPERPAQRDELHGAAPV